MRYRRDEVRRTTTIEIDDEDWESMGAMGVLDAMVEIMERDLPPWTPPDGTAPEPTPTGLPPAPREPLHKTSEYR